MAGEAELKPILEAALLAAGRPLSVDQLAALFPDEERPERGAIREAVAELQTDYAGRGIELAEVGSGFRIQVRADYAPWVSRLWDDKPGRYSRALMETLALIAYRQPITRGEIEDIRGVSVSTNIIKTLQERDWVRAVGHRDVPGRPALYGTTRDFLDYFGLRSLDELPTLAELRDLDSINRELALDDPEGAQPRAAAQTRHDAGDAAAGPQPEPVHEAGAGAEVPAEEPDSIAEEGDEARRPTPESGSVHD